MSPQPENDTQRAAEGKPLWKGKRGEFTSERKVGRRERVAAEQKVMKAAKVRDGNKCRVPRCRYAKDELVIDPAHMNGRHRKLGGDRALKVNVRSNIVSLCRRHHDDYSIHDDLRIEPLTAEDFDGPCEFFERELENGTFKHVGTEKRIGVSTTRSIR